MTNCLFDIIKTISNINNYGGMVVEFGSAIFNGEKFNLRKIVRHDEYIGVDMNAGNGVDLVCNLHKIDLPDKYADVIICSSVLEHDDTPIGTIMEMKRIIKDTGSILITVPFNWKIHCYPDDYWRMTPAGIKVLLKSYFECVQTFGVGKYCMPHTSIALIDNPILQRTIYQINKKWRYEEGSIKGAIRSLLPEIVFDSLKDVINACK